jgi:hypothetical protein
MPLKLNEFVILLDWSPFYRRISMIIHMSMGFIMFLIRASETNFYNRIFCRKAAEKRTTINNSLDSTHTEDFFERNQPLTAIISRNMNLEFMCCILYGLSEIYMRPIKKVKMSEELNFETSEVTQDLTLINRNTSVLPFIEGSVNKSDLTKAKRHKIRYKKIFDDNIDFEKLEVEVTTSKNRKTSKLATDSESSSDYESSAQDKKDHDALVIEFCPKIFKELRNLDDITGIDLYNSLNPISNSESMSKMRESEGKSGSFFFFSHDNKFLIKTITGNELNNMLGNFMRAYFEHISSNTDTLLAKIYGIYTIEIK